MSGLADRKKSSKSKKVPSAATSKSSSLSLEKVVDSSDDEQENTPEARPAKPVQLAKTPRTPAKNSITASPAVSQPELKKSEAIPAKVNGVKRKVEAQSSLEESDDGSDGSESQSESESEDEKRGVKKVKTAPVRAEAAAEESSSSEDGDQDEEMLDVEPQRQGTVNPSRSEHAASGSATFAAIPAQKFKSPPGYTALDPHTLRSPVLASSDLVGKQIWHITAPSNVPLSSLTEFTLDMIKTGKSVLSHKGTKYALSENSTGDKQTILLPSKDGYAAAEQRISKTLHLQQKINLPNLTSRQASQVTGSNAAADIAQPAISTIRPQPAGLRMRYKPPGFGSGDPGIVGLDSESDEPNDGPGQATFQFPTALGAHGGQADGRKKGKKKKDTDGEVNGTAAAAAAMVNGDGVEKISKHDKARWKEEKRTRKEAKIAKAGV